jgi:hypothetical protein
VVDWFRGHWGGRPHIFTDCRENLPPVPEWNTDFPEVLICEMAENGNVNLVLGKALSVLPEAELFEPVRNPLHRNSADFPLASTPAGGSVHILLAKDCTRSRVGAHVVQWSSADIATVHAMSALGQERTSDHLLRYRAQLGFAPDIGEGSKHGRFEFGVNRSTDLFYPAVEEKIIRYE